MRVSQLSSAISNPPVPCPGHTPTVTERALLSAYPTTHFVVPLTRSPLSFSSPPYSLTLFLLPFCLSLCTYIHAAIHFAFLSQLAIVPHSPFDMRQRENSKSHRALYAARSVFYTVGSVLTGTGRRLIYDGEFMAVSRQDDTTGNLYL